MANGILHSSIIQVSQKLEKGFLKASDLLDMCLERIRQTKDLNAFITVAADVARAQAKDADERISKGKRLGVLDGIPFAVKDNFNTSGIKTTCASKMLSNYCAPYNATVVQRLLNQGTILIGKTNMDEFAMGSGTIDSIFGPTKNIWLSKLNYRLQQNYNHSKVSSIISNNETISINSVPSENDFVICGGSSGGSAVALATGSCYGALGSDTGGSTRSPAAMCGIVGLKPTYGLLSRNGLIPLCNSLDVPGILTRNVDDAALLLCSMAGFDLQDSTTARTSTCSIMLPVEPTVENLHIGIPKEYDCENLSPEISNLWKTAADIFERSGAKVSVVSLPHMGHSVACYSVLCCSDVASNFARYDGIQYGYQANFDTLFSRYLTNTRKEGFGDVVRERIIAGNYFLQKTNYEKYFVKAAKVRRLIYSDFQTLFDSGINLLLTPVTLNEAEMYSTWIKKSNMEHINTDDYCMLPVNLAGLPAVSVPCTLSSKGLPLGLQLIGKSFDEQTLLTAAKWLEQQINFPLLELNFENGVLEKTEVS